MNVLYKKMKSKKALKPLIPLGPNKEKEIYILRKESSYEFGWIDSPYTLKIRRSLMDYHAPNPRQSLFWEKHLCALSEEMIKGYKKDNKKEFVQLNHVPSVFLNKALQVTRKPVIEDKNNPSHNARKVLSDPLQGIY